MAFFAGEVKDVPHGAANNPGILSLEGHMGSGFGI